jgi:hypothetical protein
MLCLGAKETADIRAEVAAALYRRLLKEEVTSRRIDAAADPEKVPALQSWGGGGLGARGAGARRARAQLFRAAGCGQSQRAPGVPGGVATAAERSTLPPTHPNPPPQVISDLIAKSGYVRDGADELHKSLYRQKLNQVGPRGGGPRLGFGAAAPQAASARPANGLPQPAGARACRPTAEPSTHPDRKPQPLMQHLPPPPAPSSSPRRS